MIPTFERDPLDAVGLAARRVRQDPDSPHVVAYTVQRGECSWIEHALPNDVDPERWLAGVTAANAVVVDLRTPGVAQIIHADVTCKVAHTSGRFDVDALTLDGPAAGDPDIRTNLIDILTRR